MKFASLGSGSKGNGTVVIGDSSALLIDCGFSIKDTEKRLARLGLQPSDIMAVLVTHEHSDHAKGVMPFCRKHQVPYYMTAGTAKQCKVDQPSQLLRDGVAVDIGHLSVMPVAVPHDAREPVQFVISHAGKRLGVLTDLGSISPHVVEHFADCDGLVLEANHDLDMLRKGNYPRMLKERVAGAWGHLNNEQALVFLQTVELSRIQQLVMAHISQQNNKVEHVRSTLIDIEPQLASVSYACQDEGFDWLEIH